MRPGAHGVSDGPSDGAYGRFAVEPAENVAGTEADEQAVLAHDGLEERVIGGDFRFEEGDACTASGLVACHGSGDARKQFGGGFACEGQAQNLLGTDALVDEGDDAAGHGVGFAGAGARHHDHVLV